MHKAVALLADSICAQGSAALQSGARDAIAPLDLLPAENLDKG
jgi:hypothetical protein